MRTPPRLLIALVMSTSTWLACDSGMTSTGASESGLAAPLGSGVVELGKTIPNTTPPGLFHQSFEQDVAEVLSLTSNMKYEVDQQKMKGLFNSFIRVAQDFGIPTETLEQNNHGRLYSKLEMPEGISAYFMYRPARHSLDGDMNFTVRHTNIDTDGGDEIDDATLSTLSAQFLSQYALVSRSQIDRPKSAGQVGLRAVAEDGSRKTIKQLWTHYREVNGRQVINSALKVEIQNERNRVTGVNLLNWWPLGNAAQSIAMKSASELKKELEEEVAKLVAGDSQAKLNTCFASYHQRAAELMPAITCMGNEYLANVEVKTQRPFGITVLLEQGEFLYADWDLVSTDRPTAVLGDPVYTDDSDSTSSALPTDIGDTSGARFASLTPTDSNQRFVNAAYYFKEDFKNKWSDHWYLHAYESYWQDSGSSYFLEEKVDLVFETGHGGIEYFKGQNSQKLTTNGTSSSVVQAGYGDMEYVTFTGCLAGSAVYCDGASAVSRMKDDSTDDTIFTGLHIFSSNHGIRIASSSRAVNQAEAYSENLRDGMTVIEAWEEAENDHNFWWATCADCCSKVSSPDSNCSTPSSTDFWCTRWGAYPGTFYITSKKNVKLGNRGDYSSDYRYGDSDYRMSLHYFYQSETKPVYSVGYSLP